MIGYLSGTIKAVRKNYVVLLAGEVGYKVFVIPQISLSAEPNQKLALFIHTHVREDQLSLFGFSTLPELDFFELLITVSGVGPKLGMSIMSLADLEMIKSGIVNEDPTVFTKVSGVGQKTSERLIVELKGKITDDLGGKEEGLRGLSQTHADVIDVLLALGYSRTEARQALAEVPREVTNSQDKIREALRSLAKH
jgi:Holliday junction DNA helicase RuvA